MSKSYVFPEAAPAAPDGFDLPKHVDDATLAFPANVVGTLLPQRMDIPEDIRNESWRPSRELFSEWFYSGVRGAKFVPREGIDSAMALRQIRACMGSFQPKHEHKEEGVAFLFELFFSRVEVSE